MLENIPGIGHQRSLSWGAGPRLCGQPFWLKRSALQELAYVYDLSSHPGKPKVIVVSRDISFSKQLGIREELSCCSNTIMLELLR